MSIVYHHWSLLHLKLINQGVGLSKGDAPARLVLVRPLHHSNTINDRTHANAQRTPGAVGRDIREVCLRVKGYCLVAGVIAHHVTLSAIDAHVFIYDGDHLLGIVQIVVGSDTRESTPYHVLCACECVCLFAIA